MTYNQLLQYGRYCADRKIEPAINHDGRKYWYMYVPEATLEDYINYPEEHLKAGSHKIFKDLL